MPGRSTNEGWQELEGRDAGSPERARGRRLHPHEARLAAEGALSLLRRWSRLGYAELLRAGREWEGTAGRPAGAACRWTTTPPSVARARPQDSSRTTERRLPVARPQSSGSYG